MSNWTIAAAPQTLEERVLFSPPNSPRNTLLHDASPIAIFAAIGNWRLEPIAEGQHTPFLLMLVSILLLMGTLLVAAAVASCAYFYRRARHGAIPQPISLKQEPQQAANQNLPSSTQH